MMHITNATLEWSQKNPDPVQTLSRFATLDTKQCRPTMVSRDSKSIPFMEQLGWHLCWGKEWNSILSCRQRKQIVGRESRLSAILTLEFPRTSQLAWSILSEESNGHTFTPGKCCVYLYNFSWSNNNRLYRYCVNIVWVQPCFVITLNLGFLILNSFQVYSRL